MEVETKFEVATPIIEEFRNLGGGRGPQLWNSKILFNSFFRYRHMDVETKFEVATPNNEEFRNLGGGEGAPNCEILKLYFKL